jgi:hypothetical protein
MSERPEVYLTDDMSVAVEGYREVVIDSQLHEEGDAEALGRYVLRWHAAPVWTLPGVVLMADELSPEEFATLMALEVSDEVTLPLYSEPERPAHEGGMQWAVEGWTETWDASGHRVTLAVSTKGALGLVSGWADGWTDTWTVEV